jgi:uncharacterized protein YbjT (DUF2867 family)
MNEQADGPQLLLTGATGYVGGRLLERLEAGGQRVRCLARRPERLAGRVAPTTEVVQGDVMNEADLERALAGVDTAFFLVHSLGQGSGYAGADRQAAMRFGAAAQRAGVREIVYLGGLGRGASLSSHLASRQEVGEILRRSGVPTIELRAGIIIGSGSFSFEMIRALVDRLPVMITPRWVDTRTQPIAIEDVVSYLEAAAQLTPTESRVIEIGGTDVVTYGDLMHEYARQRGMRRVMVRVPVLTPRLSSLWLGLVTPVFASVGRELIGGLRNETVADLGLALATFPQIRPRGMPDAIARALEYEDHEFAVTRWTDAFSSWGPPDQYGGVRLGSRLVDSRTESVPVSTAEAFAPVRRIGGRTGWYYADALWRMRGLIDLAVKGPGIRRGRRDPEQLAPGDTVDWWRVEEFDPDHLLRLRAEMRLPGRAWLQFEVSPEESGSLIRQTALFDPHGLLGLGYWYLLWPAHQLVFAGMIRKIAEAAAGREAELAPASAEGGA